MRKSKCSDRCSFLCNARDVRRIQITSSYQKPKISKSTSKCQLFFYSAWKTQKLEQSGAPGDLSDFQTSIVAKHQKTEGGPSGENHVFQKKWSTGTVFSLEMFFKNWSQFTHRSFHGSIDSFDQCWHHNTIISRVYFQDASHLVVWPFYIVFYQPNKISKL